MMAPEQAFTLGQLRVGSSAVARAPRARRRSIHGEKGHPRRATVDTGCWYQVKHTLVDVRGREILLGRGSVAQVLHGGRSSSFAEGIVRQLSRDFSSPHLVLADYACLGGVTYLGGGSDTTKLPAEDGEEEGARRAVKRRAIALGGSDPPRLGPTDRVNWRNGRGKEGRPPRPLLLGRPHPSPLRSTASAPASGQQARPGCGRQACFSGLHVVRWGQPVHGREGLLGGRASERGE